jgi:hypothetical protein
MKRSKSFLSYVFAIVLVRLSAAPVFACAACFGQSDSSMAKGMNMGIFALLLVITSVLCGVAGFFVFIARRTAQLEQMSPAFPKNLSQNQTNA